VIAELFAQVYANPDDDAIRHVLADALIAAGDPRGELIQHQLQPAGDHERRAMQLIQRHGLSWLGGLREVVVPLSYERGFLASCMVVAEDARPAVGRDEWATVHTIELPGRVAFALHPVMRSLRRIIGIQPNLLLELANKSQAQLATLEVSTGYAGLFETMLERYLPANSIKKLVLANVPYDRVDRLRAFAARHPRMTLELLALPPPVAVDPEYYDSTDE
jgi:uncharacterized protein (TIGR02996 family)